MWLILVPLAVPVAIFGSDGYAIADRSVPDVWSEYWPSGSCVNHPAEKPVALISRILQVAGATSVVDPFMGSGTTLCAARNLGIEAVGIEAERRYCDVAIERLAQTAMPINA